RRPELLRDGSHITGLAHRLLPPAVVCGPAHDTRARAAGYASCTAMVVMSRLGAAVALQSVASPASASASADFDLESLRQGPGLLGELERLAARWSVSPPCEQPFAWPKAVDAPPELKAFYAIAHYWPGARLYGSQAFLRP